MIVCKNVMLLLIFWLHISSVWASTMAQRIQLSKSVVKVIAANHKHQQSIGSGVIIGADEVVTNCHITRIAERIYITKQDLIFAVKSQAAMPELDICLLKTNRLPFPRVEIDRRPVAINSDVLAMGYPRALKMRIKLGKLIYLHAFNDSQVIEIDAAFTHGDSGGGIFNQNGQLIGLMTFMTHEGTKRRFFASPAVWINQVQRLPFRPLKPFKGLTYWEKGRFVLTH